MHYFKTQECLDEGVGSQLGALHSCLSAQVVWQCLGTFFTVTTGGGGTALSI